jgi:hypothetical protein
VASPGLQEEDTYFISLAVVDVLPHLFFSKLAKPPDEMVKSINSSFLRYCNKKGINPSEYIFDEMELCLGLAQVFIFYKESYDKEYPKKKKEIEIKPEEPVKKVIENGEIINKTEIMQKTGELII